MPPIRYRGIGGNPGEPQYLEPGLKPRVFLRKIGSGAGVGQNHRALVGPSDTVQVQCVHDIVGT